MGFRVHIGQGSQPISDRLLLAPQAFFRKAYPGYLLFLFDYISDSDAPVREWFERNAKALEVATGEDVAFAVLAGQFHVHLEVPDSRLSRGPQNVGKIDLDARGVDYHLSELVYARGGDWFADGDELILASQAVYEVSKALGVTGHLPCMVAIDGFPSPSAPWFCVPIRTESLREIYSQIRSALGVLQTHPGLHEYKGSLQHLRALAKRRGSVISTLSSMRSTIAKSYGEPPAFATWLREIATAAGREDQDALRSGLEKLARFHPDDGFVDEAMDRSPKGCDRHNQAIEELSELIDLQWPLSQPDLARLERLCQEVINPLLKEEVGCGEACTRLDLEALRSRLSKRRREIVHAFRVSLPSEERWRAWFRDGTREQRRAVQQAEDDLCLRELELSDAVQEILSNRNLPSWCGILAGVVSDGWVGGTEAKNSGGKKPGSPADILSWASLEESLPQVGGLDSLGLIGLFARLANRFGSAIHLRRPTAFVSYASADRPEVVRRLQGMLAFQPSLDLFLDFHSLYPGDSWRDRLAEEVVRRDRFFLFWSEAASRSDYVEAEWRMAVSSRKPITPVPLCSPEEVPPPDELKALHFGDRFQDYLRYERIAARRV